MSAASNYPDRYLPIEDYGIIGNLHTTALVSLRGSVDFLCLPRFDGPSVFARILDADQGGQFAFTCTGEDTRYKQLYLPGTNILVTRFLSKEGIAEITDFMPIARGEDDMAIFRRLKGVHGHHRIRVTVKPRFGYARRGCVAEKLTDGKGYSLSDPAGEEPTLLLITDAELAITDEGLS
ncbi:MAG: trehalase-like domain-containing protein, partial [Bacteroidota bacterium]